MQDVAEDALLEAAREAPLERSHLRRHRAGLAGVVIFFEEEEVDLGRRAPEHRLLEENGKGPRLLEISRQQQRGQPLGLAQIILEIGEKARAVGREGLGDPVSLDERALAGAAEAKIGRDGLQAERHQFARRDIVKMRQQIGVDHGAAGQVAAGKIHPALGDLQAAGTKLRLLPVASPGAAHLVAAAAHAQVVEIEPEDIVALDYVGVELGQGGVEGLEQFFPPHRSWPPAAAAGCAPRSAGADRQHAVSRPLGIAEASVGRKGLDVELAAPAALRQAADRDRGARAVAGETGFPSAGWSAGSRPRPRLPKGVVRRERFRVGQTAEHPLLAAARSRCPAPVRFRPGRATRKAGTIPRAPPGRPREWRRSYGRRHPGQPRLRKGRRPARLKRLRVHHGHGHGEEGPVRRASAPRSGRAAGTQSPPPRKSRASKPA